MKLGYIMHDWLIILILFSLHFTILSKLQSVWPEPRKTDVSQNLRRLFVPVGSSLDVSFRGGPYPKFGQPFDHFMKGLYKLRCWSTFDIRL